jgi:hypothetical protein
MPLTPGLVPSIRQVAPEEERLQAADVSVDIDENAGDQPEFDDKGNLIKVEHEDGSITISLDGSPLESAMPRASLGWFDNLVEEIGDGELNRIAEELLRGVTDDIESRREWLEDRANGIKLMGLKVEVPGLGGSAEGAPVEGMSRVRHPLLMEAVLRFQANARSELLPTDGPVKIRNDDNNADLGEDQLATALEMDLNHYLTVTASEYYPDTDRMLLMLGFGGTAFKKVYLCPLRNRPVSETVDAADLIVNNAATDLKNARRITHRVTMKPSTVKRLQILGVYRDTELSTPMAQDLDSVQREKNAQQGIQPESLNPEDRDREIYECYCELNISGFEHKWKSKETGLQIPYVVTIDVSSRKILSIRRNYDEDTEELPEQREVFVKYSFVPGFGFYDLGLLNILGNTTNAITAAWREMLDAGMFANFPGFLLADAGARQNTNIFRVPPGGGALVKTGGMPINQAVMPLPYKEPGASMMSLVQNMAETGMRVGGTSELPVGEGRQDAPVGTTIALIEQAQKVLNAVHKRMHAAQAQEFQLIARCFRENPGSFWQRNRTPAYPWDEATFLKALENYELIPQADPNTASHTQRVMKVMALKQLQAAQPGLYDPIAIDTAALHAIGWSNPQQFMLPQHAQGRPTPEMIEMQAKAQNDSMRAQATMMDAQSRAQKTQADIAQGGQKVQIDAMKASQDAQINAAKIGADTSTAQRDNDTKTDEMLSRERIQLVDLAQNLAVHPDSAQLVQPLLQPALQHVLGRQNEQDAMRRARNAPVVPGGLVPPSSGGPTGVR